jgi:cephalosporin hydroxylase
MKEYLKKIIPPPLVRAIFDSKRKIEKLSRAVPEAEKVHVTLKSIYQGQFKVTYRGISTLRVPFDYVMYQMIINEVRPDLVIEIGTNLGGTTLYLADFMDTLGHGMIHTVDIDSRSSELVRNHPRIKLFANGWEGYDLHEADGYKKILLLDDGSHTYSDVLGALQKFAPLVSLGSYYIVEDGIIDEMGLTKQYDGGPLRAIREFLPEHSEFEVDRTYCDMFGTNATGNVNGYLKRVA